jgi:aromatic ring-cleaving dioxygenase
MKRTLAILFAFVWAVVMLTRVQAQAETLKTRIGDRKTLRGVVAALREKFGPHATAQRRNERLKKEIMDLVT